MAIIPYFRLAGKSKRWPRSVSRHAENLRPFVVRVLLAHAEGDFTAQRLIFDCAVIAESMALRISEKERSPQDSEVW
jgi:hypothetical protein